MGACQEFRRVMHEMAKPPKNGGHDRKLRPKRKGEGDQEPLGGQAPVGSGGGGGEVASHNVLACPLREGSCCAINRS